MQRINFWSSPRNISTALMYSFAQRSDTTVVDEPLYAHYLTHTDSPAQHPGHEQILASQDASGSIVVEKVLFGPYPTPVALFKQMTHHLQWLDRSFLHQMQNVLLIRNPRAIIASYSKVIHNPGIEDIGIKMQYELFEELNETGHINAVLDARELLLSPPSVLTQLCQRLALPFDQNMLRWEAGARPEDGVWAPHWYANVHKSTGFQPYVEKVIDLPTHLEPLAAECQPYYDKLLAHAIKGI